MSLNSFFLFLTFGSPAILLISHVCVSRFAKNLPPQNAALLGIFFGLALSFAALFLTLPLHGLSSAFYAATVLLSEAYIYFHFFNTSETARRIRILHEVKEQGFLTEEQVQIIFERDDLIGTRLERMIALGQLGRAGDTYYLKGRLLFLGARIVTEWRKILKIG